MNAREARPAVLEDLAVHHDTAYTRLRASLLALRSDESLLDLDVQAVVFVERELVDVLHRLDGVRFAVERLHAKAGQS